MQQDIGIRMAEQTKAKRYCHAANNQSPSGDQRMTVIALTDAKWANTHHMSFISC
jgi:hypothetical protein